MNPFLRPDARAAATLKVMPFSLHPTIVPLTAHFRRVKSRFPDRLERDDAY